MEKTTHPVNVAGAYERILKESSAEAGHIEIDGGHEIHVVEAGSGPRLMSWGERDPLGGADVALAISEAIPNCVLEVLPAGHAPWLGYPDKMARLISDFVLSG